MTKTVKKSLALILSILMLMSVMPMSISLAATENDFTYEVVDNKATIIGYTGTDTDIVIPETLGGYPVVAVGVEKERAKANNFMPFHSNVTITSVVLPSSVKYIGYGAFYKCTALESVSLGAGLEVIDEGAFRSCSSLEYILLGWNITTVGVNSFKDCSALYLLNIGTKLSSVGTDAFAGCGSSMSINYEGTSEQWDNISFDSGNENVKESEYITFFNGKSCGIYGHPTEMTPAKDPTCTEAGNIEYYTCEVCGEIFADDIEDSDDVIIPALGHKFDDIKEAIGATCTDEGNAAYWHCEVCNKYFADAEAKTTFEDNDPFIAINDNNHSFGNWYSIDNGRHKRVCAYNGNHVEIFGCADSVEDNDCKCDVCGIVMDHNWCAATCTDPKTCSVCGLTDESALGHDMVDATCTEPSKCKREGCDYTEDEANGHDKGEAEVDYIYFAPTCNGGGFHGDIYCTVCGILIEYAAGIPNLGHEFEIVAEKSTYPTCVDAGYYYKECTREGCDETEEEWPSALDHQFAEEWTTETEATCTTNGSEHRTCVRDNCKETQSRTIDAFNHIGTDTSTATENEQVGTCVDFTTYETVVYCSCGYEISRTPVTEAKNPDNHTNLVATAATANTCETDGNIDYWTCAGCLKIYSDAAATTEITAAQTVIEKKGHAYGDAWTFDADGEHKRVCANDATHIEIEACADVTTDTDCLCDKCGHLVSHSFGDPTCTAPATCSVCDETTGSETGHDYGDWEYDEELDKHIAICANDEEHIIYGDCENANADEDCECDYCDIVMAHDFEPANCSAPKTCKVCEATEGEINAENHAGGIEYVIEDYIEGTCTTEESYNTVTYCLGCDEAIDSEEFEGEKDPDNHQLKEVIPNGGKDKVHYNECEREGCEYKEDIPHNLGAYSIYDPATCTAKGRERAHCSICKSFIFRDIPVIPHVDANKNAKCDVCDTVMELPVEPEPEEPDAEEPPVVEDPSVNCSCNCHARGLRGLFFSIVLFFQRLLGLNRTCDCGNAHY